jgi:outer membrane protein assembly factor BamA
MKVDLRHYLNVWRKRIFATRFYLHRIDADDGNPTALPVNLLSRLGGPAGLRGYTVGRYMDNDMVLASIEWRFPVWKVIDGFAFLDEGRVFDDIADARVFKGWIYSAGMGLRVWNKDAVSLATTIGFGDEGVQFQLGADVTW